MWKVDFDPVRNRHLPLSVLVQSPANKDSRPSFSLAKSLVVAVVIVFVIADIVLYRSRPLTRGISLVRETIRDLCSNTQKGVRSFHIFRLLSRRGHVDPGRFGLTGVGLESDLTYLGATLSSRIVKHRQPALKPQQSSLTNRPQTQQTRERDKAMFVISTDTTKGY